MSADERLSAVEAVRYWLDLDADGELSPEEAVRLEAALAERPELERERRELERLHADLAVRVPVREGFRESVMEALPTAAWEPAGRRGRVVALGVAALLATLSAALVALGGTGEPGPALGLLAAVGEALEASILTGAGLLGASWRGLGLALQELLTISPAALAMFGVGVVALNVLFVRLLLRRTLAVGKAVRSGGGDPVGRGPGASGSE